MKKALTLLFTFMVVGALALPVFAQDTAGQDNSAATTKKSKKKKHSKKAKNADSNTAAPQL